MIDNNESSENDNPLDEDLDPNEDDVSESNMDELNDSMDGDHESALRDAGFGTDEDYGYYGGEDEVSKNQTIGIRFNSFLNCAYFKSWKQRRIGQKKKSSIS